MRLTKRTQFSPWVSHTDRVMGLLAVIVVFVLSPVNAVANSGHCSPTTQSVCDLLDQAQNNRIRSTELLQQALVDIDAGQSNTPPDSAAMAEWLHVRWMYHLVRDEHVLGVEVLKRASALLQKLPSSQKQLTEIYNSLSYSYNALGNVTQARASLRAAIQIALSNQLVTLPDLYYALGESYRRTHEAKIAKVYFEEALALFEQDGNTFGRAITLNKLGTVARTFDDLKEAISLHAEARTLFGDEQAYRQLVTDIELARDYLAAADISQSMEYALWLWQDERLLAAQKIDVGLVMMDALRDRSADYAGYITSAGIIPEQLVSTLESLFEQASRGNEEINAYPLRQIAFYETATRYFHRQKDKPNVRRYGDLGLAVSNRLATALKGQHENYFALLQQSHTLLTGYVEALYDLDRSRIPQILDARFNWRHPVADIATSRTVASARENDEIERFRNLVRAEEALISYTSSTADPTQSSQNSTKRATDLARLEKARIHSRDLFLGTRNTGVAEPSMERQPLALTGSEAPAIDATDVVLRYFIQDSLSFVVAQTKNQTQFFDLPKRTKTKRLVTDVVQQLKDRSRDPRARFEALARAEELVPLEWISQQPGIERMVIVADDSMHLLPFAALNGARLTDSARYQPLGAHFDILRTHSVASYYQGRMSTAVTSPTRETDIAIFADPVLHSVASLHEHENSPTVQQWFDQLEALPYTAKEAEHIKNAFPNRTVRIFVGENATASALRSAEVRRANVLHIATHGYFDESTPSIVGLLTAADQNSAAGSHLFSLSSLVGQTYSSNLVIISGCETMRGREIDGLGAKSMAEMFLASGAGSAIGTLWKVPDQGSAHFMRTFHQALQTHQGNASKALRQTRASMAQSRRYADPIYWAGFVLDSTQSVVDQNVFSKLH